MNFNNHKLENIMKTNNNFKAMFVGILLIAATFSLMTSNTNGPTVFAQSSNNPRGVEYTVTISDLPKQTADASTVVTLSNNQPDAYFGVGV